MSANKSNAPTPPAANFIRQIVEADIAKGKNGQGSAFRQVVTRFPPEPNGYLHIGHAKSICLNFGLAKNFEGKCHLRFDDTNPLAEDVEYVESIQESVRWLGFDWGKNLFYASDYFDKLYEFAVQLIEIGKAYVDESTVEDIRKMRGTLTEPGKNSPYRDRPIKENLDLFTRMKNGEFPDGKMVLRAKIDMNSPNMNMRDPLIYRIRKAHHHRSGDKWCIYPLYDFTHGLSDMLEGITHSICTLEFEDHRPLYDWFLKELKTPCHPQQIEFARLNLDYTVMSKRKLLQLVEEKRVSGWDDPRLPTIDGMRRRGYTPEAIRLFCERIGVTRKDSVIELGALEHAVREDLDERSIRMMAVLKPIKVVITNYPENSEEMLEASMHPKKDLGKRKIPFGREIYIESDDFMENPPADYHRLKPGGIARLRYAYVIQCDKVIKDASGNVTELHCTYDVETKAGFTPPGKPKAKGIIHWVSCKHAKTAEVRLYDRLFSVANPSGDEFLNHINPNSLETISKAFVEPITFPIEKETFYQFERLGFFCSDLKEHDPKGKWVFNRTVTLKDGWSQPTTHQK